MAQVKKIQLPEGWTDRTGGPMSDIIRMGRPGRRHLQDNDPLFCWNFTVSYKRTDFDEDAAARFEDIYAFFLVTKGFAFLVDDIADNTATANRGQGIIKQLNGVWRLWKRYSIFGAVYDHPITRPKLDVVVSAGALDYDTGIVTGIGSEQTWIGGFKRPMLFSENGLRDRRTPGGIIEAFDVALEEQFEF
jgi:hypothetical protein